MRAPGVRCRCGGIVRDRVCDRCGPKRKPNKKQKDRPHNNRRWYAHSRAYLRDNPLCVDCLSEGRTTLSTETHHIAKARENPDMMYDDANLMALCRNCHSVRTGRGE